MADTSGKKIVVRIIAVAAILVIIIATSSYIFLRGTEQPVKTLNQGEIPTEPATVPGQSTISGPVSGEKLQVITSFRPITILVAPIAGDNADITQILAPGAEPHEYEPTPKDVAALQKGNLFFYDSPGLEPWAERLTLSANPQMKLAPFTDAIPSSVINDMKKARSDSPNPETDPHLWLSPKMALYYIPYVTKQLSEADPNHAGDYQRNADTFIVRMQKLDAEYTAGLAHCHTRTFLTSHSFLNYQAVDYNLTELSLTGMSMNAQPSIQQMAAVLKQAKAQDVKGVLAASDESQQLSQSMAEELDIPLYSYMTLEILPKGTLTPADNDYVAVMENNLQEMRMALKCQ